MGDDERQMNETKLVNAFRKWLSAEKKVMSIKEERFVDVSFDMIAQLLCS